MAKPKMLENKFVLGLQHIFLFFFCGYLEINLNVFYLR